MDPPPDMSPSRPPTRIGELWQVPALLGAIVALAGAITVGVLTAPAPPYDAMLRGAERHIDAQRYEEALGLLNDEAFVAADAAALDSEQGHRLHVLRARAVAYGQKALGLSRRDNHARIVAEYEAALEHVTSLEAQDTALLARSLVALGRFDDALARAAHLGDEHSDSRIAITQEVIEAVMPRNPAWALTLLAELRAESDLSSSHDAWALARQAKILTDMGRAQEAVGVLSRALPALLPGLDATARAELSMRLGEAYLRTDEVEKAASHLHEALDRFAPSDPLRGDALVLLGRIDELRGNLRAALDRYTLVLDVFSTRPAALPALLGLGRVHAHMGDDEASLATHERLVTMSEEGRVTHPDVDAQAITESLLFRFSELHAAGRTQSALAHAVLAERLYAPGALPVKIIMALAQGHRSLGDARVGDMGEGLDRVIRLANLDLEVRNTARKHFVQAARYYEMLADRVAATDPEAYADALWNAADCADLAGDRRGAIDGFARCVSNLPHDARRPEAMFRLAQACQAAGDYVRAQRLYRNLIVEGEATALEPARGAGGFAQASYVPLAQLYLRDADEENDGEALVLLDRVTSGALGAPEASYFREALIMLARLHYQAGRGVEAIERLEEAIARYPNDDRRASLTFMLADARRLEADAIASLLKTAMPDHERHVLEQRRVEHLELAVELYADARDRFEAKGEIVGVEQTYLRNAYFYIGACAFDLGDYDAAIDHYVAARERYPDDPSSLAAMIQIVHAHVQAGDLRSARIANERARRFYESLPPEAWQDPSLALRREDWERWLDLGSRLESRAQVGDNDG